MSALLRTSAVRPMWLGLALIIWGTLATAAWADPPALVARMDQFDGTATLLPSGSTDWSYANINRPLSNGDQIWIGAASRAELVAGSTAMRLGANTSLTLLELSDAATQLKLTQGTFEVRVREPMRGRSFEIDTPNLAFDLQTPGDYRVDVNAGQDTTTVIVRAGQGMAYGAGGTSYPIGGRQLVQFSGNGLTPDAAEFDPPLDGFDRWVALLNRRENDSISAHYVGIEMTGYQGLDQYGRWETNPTYGSVWVPTVVAPGWAPYHDGHWAWIAPWGWTWIDDEPWGFAPFHYGRWAYVGSSWVWVPGPVIARPIYAPALVAFIGGGGAGGMHWGVSLSIGAPGIAWFALAPGEIYRPVYAASPTYINAINRTVIVNQNVTIIHNTAVINNIQRTVYVNQTVPGAVTAVPAAAFVRGRPVQEEAVPFHVDPARAAPVLFSPPIAPVEYSVVGRQIAPPPPHAAFARTVVATRNPPLPPALHDTLAQRFAAHNGTAPGAGQTLIAQHREQPDRFAPARQVTVIPVQRRSDAVRPIVRQPMPEPDQPTLTRPQGEMQPRAAQAEPGETRSMPVPHPPGVKMPAHQALGAPLPRLPEPQRGERPFSPPPQHALEPPRQPFAQPERRPQQVHPAPFEQPHPEPFPLLQRPVHPSVPARRLVNPQKKKPEHEKAETNRSLGG